MKFINAARNCDFQELQKVLKCKGLDVNMRIRSATTPLMQAAEKGSCECVDLLITSGADVNLFDFNQKTALRHAVENGHVDCATSLIAAKADVNVIDKWRETALFTAISSGDETLVNLLCDAGADVNRANNASNTPLIFATIYGHVELIKKLVSLGAGVNAKNIEKQTALTSFATEKQLLRFDKSQKRMYKRKSKAKSKPNVECAQVLLELGAHVEVEDRCGRTPLYCALEANYLDCAKLLLKQNADIQFSSARSDWVETWRGGFESEGYELLYAGGREDENDVKVMIENFEQRFNVDGLSLKCMCRKSIRHILIANNPRSNLFYLVDELPLPTALKSMLVYHML